MLYLCTSSFLNVKNVALNTSCAVSLAETDTLCHIVSFRDDIFLFTVQKQQQGESYWVKISALIWNFCTFTILSLRR